MEEGNKIEYSIIFGCRCKKDITIEVILSNVEFRPVVCPYCGKFECVKVAQKGEKGNNNFGRISLVYGECNILDKSCRGTSYFTFFNDILDILVKFD